MPTHLSLQLNFDMPCVSEVSECIDVDSEEEEVPAPPTKMTASKAGSLKPPVSLAASASVPAVLPTPAEIELQELKLKHEKLLQLYYKQTLGHGQPAVASPEVEKAVFTPSPAHVEKNASVAKPLTGVTSQPVPKATMPAQTSVAGPQMTPVVPAQTLFATPPVPSSDSSPKIAPVPQPVAEPKPDKSVTASPALKAGAPKAPLTGAVSVGKEADEAGQALQVGEEKLAEELSLDAEDGELA